METIEYRTFKKSTWGSGPWQDEPDKKQWEDEATGYPCLIVRNRMGALCGYVGVGKGHPLYETGYDDAGVYAHGGLTFAAHCQVGVEEDGVCHKTDGPDDIWWFGFDCLHAGDSSPPVSPYGNAFGFGIYRDIAYVTDEVRSLAAQLKVFEGEAA